MGLFTGGISSGLENIFDREARVCTIMSGDCGTRRGTGLRGVSLFLCQTMTRRFDVWSLYHGWPHASRDLRYGRLGPAG